MRNLIAICTTLFVISARANDENCSSDAPGFDICKKSNVVVHISQTANNAKLALKLNSDAKIDGGAFNNVTISKLKLEFGKNPTGLHTLSLVSESFRGLSNLISLEIKRAHINVSGNPFASLVGLKKLQFKHCKYTNVPSDLLKSLPNLKELNLKHNDINVVHSRAFITQVHLKELSLANNEITTLEPDCFTGLVNLEKLNLKSNKFTSLPPVFGELGKLKKLNLNRNVELRALEPRALLGLRNLLELNLKNTNLENFDENTFNDLSRLRCLEVGSDCVKKIAKNTFHHLTALKALEISGRAVETVETGAFAGLNLTYLEFSHSGNLQNLQVGIFDDLQVEILVIKQCNLGRISSGVFNNLKTLRYLQLSKNDVEMIEENAFSGLNLTTLDLSHNRKFTALRDIFGDLRVKNLKIRANSIQMIFKNTFNSVKSLKSVDLSRNQITDIEANAFFGLNLTVLNLSLNNLKILKSGTFHGLTVGKLLLNYCNIVQVKPSAFTNLTANLVHLSSNNIAKINVNDFSGLVARELNLRRNKIEEIATGAFQNTTLKVINLVDNPIEKNFNEDKCKWGLPNSVIHENNSLI